MKKTCSLIGLVLYLIGVLTVGTLHASNQPTLSGISPSYCGQTITFLAYSELLTYKEDTLGIVKVDSVGKFSLPLNFEHTTYVFAHLGQYHAYLYCEPEKSYDLALPEYKEKSKADKLNPFFEEGNFHIGIVNMDKDDLNLLIVMFDDMFVPYMNKLAYDAYKKNSDSEIDDAISALQTPFADVKNSYFKNYVTFKLGLLKNLAFQVKSRAISGTYFLNKPVFYQNTAYMELFHQIYDRYFTFFGKTDEGKQIYHVINQSASLDSLKLVLSKDEVLKNDTLLELVILKSVFDEFFSNQFSRSGLLKILTQVGEQTAIPEHQLMAQNVFDRIKVLLIGFDPPDFRLPDIDGNYKSLTDFKGKWVYLNFCNCVSYTCLKEYENLRNLYEKHHEILDIVTIVLEDDMELMQDMVTRYKYPWTFLLYSAQPSVLSKYDIRGFPTYFLIDKNGKLAQSPAPAPGENFEFQFFKILRARSEL